MLHVFTYVLMLNGDPRSRLNANLCLCLSSSWSAVFCLQWQWWTVQMMSVWISPWRIQKTLGPACYKVRIITISPRKCSEKFRLGLWRFLFTVYSFQVKDVVEIQPGPGARLSTAWTEWLGFSPEDTLPRFGLVLPLGSLVGDSLVPCHVRCW